MICTILVAAGFDSPLAIADLDENDIKTIQSYVSNKAPHLLKGHNIYSESEPFEFLPGHVKVLHSLKKRATDFITQRKEPRLIPASEEIELLSDSEIDQAKKNLIDKLNLCINRIAKDTTNAAHDVSLAVFFKEANIIGSIDAYISNFSRVTHHTSSYKCSVKCLFCEKITPCTLNKHWQTTNFENHLKTHRSLIADLVKNTAEKIPVNRELNSILDS